MNEQAKISNKVLTPQKDASPKLETQVDPGSMSVPVGTKTVVYQGKDIKVANT